MRKAAAILFIFFLGVFEVSAQSVKVTSPNGGEQWALNSSQAITWTSANAGSVKVNIVLRTSGGKVGVIKSQVALSAGSFTWTSVGTLEDGTPVGPGTNYIVRIREVGNTFFDDSDAAFSISGGPTPAVIKKLPPLERAPVSLIFPPQPRITEFTIDKASTFFHINAKNFGGAMKQDAQVVLILPGGPGYKMLTQTWPKGQETFAMAGRLFANDNNPHLDECKHMGGGDYCLSAEIRSPEVAGYPYPGLLDGKCGIPCWQDLAVSGFQWNTSGALSFSVGNNGYCPSCPWTYRLYKMGQLVETSIRYGSKAPGSWSRITAKYVMPANSGGSCLFKVEVVPETPGFEKNTANNSCEYRVVPNAAVHDVVISDIKLSGEVEYWENHPPTSDAYNRLVPILKNTSNKEYSEVFAKIQIAIDNGPVSEVEFTLYIGPFEEVPLSHSRWGLNLPVLPEGTHTVVVAVSLCPTFMKKTMTRPPEG